MKKFAIIILPAIWLINFICLNDALAQKRGPAKNRTIQEKKSEEIIVKKQSNIEGLGIFKIGKTEISIISDLENELGTKSVVTSDSFEVYKAKGRSNVIFQLVPKNKSGYDQYSICPDVKEYEIPLYAIADMQINGLHHACPVNC